MLICEFYSFCFRMIFALSSGVYIIGKYLLYQIGITNYIQNSCKLRGWLKEFVDTVYENNDYSVASFVTD